MMRLPDAPTDEAYAAIGRDDPRLLRGAQEVAARHGVAGPCERFAGGSLPVFAVGAEHVVKLYPPWDAAAAAAEHAALRAVDARLPIPTPRPYAAGELDGWRYLVMARLRGRGLHEAWPELAAPDQEALVEQLGAATAALHALAPATVDVGVPRPDWPAFLAAQRAGCVDRQRGRGLAPAWLDQVSAFLAAAPLAAPAAPALLHTELMREHLLVAVDAAGRPRLTGLIDFEPAMVGAPSYDLASVAVFVTAGEPRLVRRFVAGYGHAPAAREVMAYLLLHRYSSLPWYLERVPPPPGVTTLEQLADAWWPT
ncbi:MAG: phosphotransferase [Kofleriaceae bacterium]|nr:phosphotransferase [Kofleriaceae bacterium]